MSVFLKSGILQQGSLFNYTQEYKAILESYTNKPSRSTSALQNELIETLVNGGIWDKAIMCYLFAQDSNIGSDALLNIKNIGTYDLLMGFNAGGANPVLQVHSGIKQGAGNKSFLDTQWSGKVNSPSLKDDISVLAFSDDLAGTGSFVFGCQDLSPQHSLYSGLNYASSRWYLAVNDTAVNTYFSDSETRGFSALVRRSSSEFSGFINQKKYTTATASSDLPTPNMTLLAVNINGTKSGFFTAPISFLMVTTGLVDSEITIARQAIGKYMQKIGSGYYYAVFDGDSLTAGSGSTGGNTYPKQVADRFLSNDSKRLIGSSFGVAGQTLTQMESDAATQIDVLYDKLQDVLVAWGGVNDFGLEIGTTKETIYQRYVTYCTNRKAAGWKVYATTMLPQSYSAYSGRTDFETERQWFNEQVKNNLSLIVDGIVDVASDSRIGQSGDELNTTYFDSDKIHLNNTGYGIIADYVYAAIRQNVLNVT